MVQDQQDVCAYCESALNRNYHVDHMIPLSREGRNDWSNLAVTCGSCNRSKGTMTVEESLRAVRVAELGDSGANFV
jgi:5-methylcytosine-specific restriction endonuclease McrA